MSDLKTAAREFEAALERTSTVTIKSDMFPIGVDMSDAGEMAALEALEKAAKVLKQKYRHGGVAVAGLAYGFAMGRAVKQLVTQQDSAGANIIYALVEEAKRVMGKILQNDQKGFKVFFPAEKGALGRTTEQIMAYSTDKMYEYADSHNVARYLKRKDDPKGVTLTLSMADADKGTY